MSQRKYDVILYGASGFTGRQTVDYFAKYAPAGLMWAIAGRNREKLEVVNHPKVDVLVADGADSSALANLAAQTSVVATTAGPFTLYGTPLVEACVKNRTHYVDITGETPWIRTLIDRFHKEAEANETRIIPCCGFDSIPSDYGAWILAQKMKDVRRIYAYFQVQGGVNGGTLATVFHQAESGSLDATGDPYLLNPAGARDPIPDPVGARFDAQANCWVAPFVMGPINTRVVRRTQALLGLRPFEYLEFSKFDSSLSAHAVAWGGKLLPSMMTNSMLRKGLKALAPKPGQGPSDAVMDNGWFRCQMIGTGPNGERAEANIYGKGDPGNRVTVKCLCESALLLATGSANGLRTGGVLTPVAGLGEALIDRLKAREITFS